MVDAPLTGRDGLRAWVRTGAGPWVTAGIDVAPGDLDAFHRENVTHGVGRIRRLVAGLLLLNLVGWAGDPWLLDGIPGVQPALFEGRVTMTGFGLAVLALSWLPPLRRGAGAVALAWVGACGLCGGLAWFMGRIGGPSTAWFHFNHISLAVTLLAWAAPLHRLVLVGATVGVSLLAYFGGHPSHLRDPLAGASMTHLLLVAALVLGVGLWLDASRLRLFLFARATTRQSAALEARVAAQTVRIQGLLDHVEAARETERRELAAELHDELGQVLTGLRLTLRVARTRAAAEGSGVAGLLDQLGEMTAHLGGAVRDLLARLRPRVLDDLGFVAAAEWLVRRTDALPGARCSFGAAPDLPGLSRGGATVAFRVLQEALTNAVRHAGASRIDVRLAGAAGAVVLSVVDDGAGFAAGAASEGMGLMGMRERARSQAGSLRVESAPGGGTRVVLTLPAAAGEEEG